MPVPEEHELDIERQEKLPKERKAPLLPLILRDAKTQDQLPLLRPEVEKTLRVEKSDRSLKNPKRLIPFFKGEESVEQELLLREREKREILPEEAKRSLS